MAKAIAFFASFPGCVLLLSLGALGMSASAAPSFNCRYAKSPDEVQICHDPRLSSLDEQMAALFFKLRNAMPPAKQARLDAEQQAWLRVRGSCGGDADCIAALYTRRIGQLSPSIGPGAKIAYGSRGGMEVTVRSVEAVDTSHAVIQTQHTRADAIKFCQEYIGAVTAKCVNDELATPLNEVISADCPHGTFTNFYGDKLQFGGSNRNADSGPRYILKNLRTGEVADGSSASGYDVNMEIFKALCPATAPAEP